MWAKAAKEIAKFPQGVITAFDGGGELISVRQTKLPYDATSGEMVVTIPDALSAAPGLANLLCHVHDEKLWNNRAISLKGRLERRQQQWVFVTTAFEPLSPFDFIKKIRRSTKSYLQKRGLAAPVVNFAVIDSLWVRARQIKDP